MSGDAPWKPSHDLIGPFPKPMNRDDIVAEAREAARLCGSCDAGLTMNCTCSKRDLRAIICDLLDEIERLRAERGDIIGYNTIRANEQFAFTTADDARQWVSEQKINGWIAVVVSELPDGDPDGSTR